MKSLRGLIVLVFYVLAVVLITANTVLAADSTYNASYEPKLEILPNDICWTYYDSGQGSIIDFNNGNLVIDTTTEQYQNYDFFYQNGSLLTAPTSEEPWIIEFKAKQHSNSSYHSARTSMRVNVSSLNNYGNTLYIGQSEIFLLSDPFTKGDSASIDTSIFHVYTIVVDVNQNMKVYVDDPEMLSSPLIEESLNYYSGWTPQIDFGDGTNSANGKSEWSYFKHNAYNGICGVFFP